MESNQEKSSTIELPRSSVDNMVGNIFTVHMNEEVIELSNEFCKYYYATDDSGDEEFFAIIFENSFIARIDAFDFTLKNPINGLNNILAYSVVYLSTINEERLVAIVKSYDPNMTLANQLQKNMTIDLDEAEKIIESINNIITTLKDNKIFCCNINPENILMKNGKFYALREFINTYPNFHQKEQYLAPELIECHQAARYTKNTAPDIYALGVSIFEAYSNKARWKDHGTIKEYNHARFENGSNKYLLSSVKLPEKLRSLLKMTMHDDASVRWNNDKISDWIDGKNTKLVHDSLVDNKTTIGFNNQNYSNLKSLAYAFFNNWDEAMKFMKETKLLKWVSREQLSNDILEEINSLWEKKGEVNNALVSTYGANKKLIKFLSLIDQNGPLRKDGFAISPVSIPYLLYYLSTKNNKNLTEAVVNIIKNEDWTLYSNYHNSTGHLSKTDSSNLLINTSGITSKNSLSLEKYIHLLNPDLVCQSRLLKDRYVTSIPELLKALDQYAAKNYKKFTIDRNIIAFIEAKLGLKEEIKSKILPNFPKFSESPVIRGLIILDIAQKTEPDIEIPNICKAISYDLGKMFDEHLYSVDFKKEITEKIEKLAQEANLEKIIKEISNQQQFINDYNGYYEACRKVKLIEQKIRALNSQDNIFNGALLLGQKLTVLLSYILCFIVTVSVIM